MNTRAILAALTGLCLATPVMAEDAVPSQAPQAPIVVPAAPAVPLSPEDAAKRAAAERYYATQDENGNFERMLSMLAGSLRNPAITPQQRQDFVDYARAHLDRAQLKNGMIDAMVQTYTLPELKALGDFYTSPAGRGVLEKQAAFQTAANTDAFFPAFVTFMQAYAAQCTDKTKCIDLATLSK
jgi:hypothetical protein